MENLYDVMLNQMYPRVSEAERIAEDAEQIVRQSEKEGWKDVDKLDRDIWKRIKHVDELEDSIEAREFEMMNDDNPDPDGYRLEAIRELMNLGFRVRKASRMLTEVWDTILKVFKRQCEKSTQECAHLKLELEEMEKILKNTRNSREK